MWTICLSWSFAPFWFNPLAFDMTKTREDWKEWNMWMRRIDPNSLKSWRAWLKEEFGHCHTNKFSRQLHVLFDTCRWGMVFLALIHHSSFNNLVVEYSRFAASIVALILVAFLLWTMCACVRGKRHQQRALNVCLFAGTVVLVVVLLKAPMNPSTDSTFPDKFQMKEALHFLVAAAFLVAALSRFTLVIKPFWIVFETLMWWFDYLLGLALFGLLFSLSTFSLFKDLQAAALFKSAFNRGVQYADLLNGPKI